MDALLALKKLADVSKEQYLNGVKQFLDEARLTPDELVAMARKRPRTFEKQFADFLVKRVLATTLGRVKARLTFVCTCYNLFRPSNRFRRRGVRPEEWRRDREKRRARMRTRHLAAYHRLETNHKIEPDIRQTMKPVFRSSLWLILHPLLHLHQQFSSFPSSSSTSADPTSMERG